MSARERSRYFTVAAVFSLAFVVLGALIVRSAMVMAQDYTFRPSAATANTYAAGVPSTQRLNFAYDPNINTAAKTYTNADFSGDGVTPDIPFEYSGSWSIFQQTTTFLRAVELYVVRQGTGNALNQWRIQYTLDGATGPEGSWVTLEDGTVTANPAKGEISTTIPDDTDLENDLAVRTMSRQENATDAVMEIFDIRVEAEWDEIDGGIYHLQIDTLELPDGVKNEPYTISTIEASGGNPYMPGDEYDWEQISGALPPGLSWTPALPAQSDSIQLSGTPTEANTRTGYTFTIRVSDDVASSEVQYDSIQYTIMIAGLGIDPPGPDLEDWDPMVVGTDGSQTFYPEGGTPYPGDEYDWCLVSGTIPPGLSWSPALPSCATAVATAASLYLSDPPTNAGTYSFTIRLADSGVEEPVEHYYQVGVSSSYVTIIGRLLRPIIKGIGYGTGALQMTPQYLTAINVLNASNASEVYWTSTGLPAGLSLQGTTLNTTAQTSTTYIGGTVAVGTASGTYNVTVTADDALVRSDSTVPPLTLEVLGRRTLLRRAPPTAVVLPANHTLDFVVSASGGAPSNSGDTALDPNSTAYYTYYWEVTPVGDSPALDTASGIADGGDGSETSPPYAPGPLLIPILFESSNAAVVGTYDVTFRARDYLRRENDTDPADSDYRFVPVRTRIQVVSPAGRTLEQDATRPTLLRQEQFR